jgi:hypothetical protein
LINIGEMACSENIPPALGVAWLVLLNKPDDTTYRPADLIPLTAPNVAEILTVEEPLDPVWLPLVQSTVPTVLVLNEFPVVVLSL